MSQDAKSTPAMNRPCTRCGKYRIRPVEDIAAELYAAPSEARTFGGSEGWELLELIAMQLAEEIRGICAACHANDVLNTAPNAPQNQTPNPPAVAGQEK